MEIVDIILLFIGFVAFELLYIKLAKQLGIVDNPNNRTMHTGSVIRGGGLIFTLSYLVYYIFFLPPSSLFFYGLLIISVVSYVDDLRNLVGWVRIFFQLLAVLLMFLDLDLLRQESIIIEVVGVIIAVGILNAFNFMDGINGITAGYSCSVLIILLLINQWIVGFIDLNFLIIVIVGVLTFALFNFRKKALCFAGDVGSVVIGFLITYMILKLILATNNFIWILLLLVYGLDVVITILQRIQNRENIFDAHRKHLFQIAISKLGISHVLMSLIYSLGQLIISSLVVVIYVFDAEKQILWALVLLIGGTVSYLYIKTKITGSVWLSEEY